MEVIKAFPTASEPQATSIPPSWDPKSDSPKKLKSDGVIQAELVITTLMHDLGSSHKTNSSSEFKFWSNSFDGL